MNLIKLDCRIIRETDQAILIDFDHQELWLPKSVIQFDRIGDENGIVFIPEWLARKKRLDC